MVCIAVDNSRTDSISVISNSRGDRIPDCSHIDENSSCDCKSSKGKRHSTGILCHCSIFFAVETCSHVGANFAAMISVSLLRSLAFSVSIMYSNRVADVSDSDFGRRNCITAREQLPSREAGLEYYKILLESVAGLRGARASRAAKLIRRCRAKGK